jgi:hypothetical protein
MDAFSSAFGRSLRQRTKQLAHPVPHDLHADTNQQERSKFHNHIRSRRTENEDKPICEGVAEIDSCCYEC